jgi:arabinose-5-phosphate isomerase
MDDDLVMSSARRLLELEAAAVWALVDRIDLEFAAAVEHIRQCRGQVVVTGLGKSGLIGRKIASTLTSTQTPAVFVHASDALHGDAGTVRPGDVLIALSNSGETPEVCQFVEIMTTRGVASIALTAQADCTLSGLATCTLVTGVKVEADPLGIVPTASAIATLALGDALVAALMAARGLTYDQFHANHPGGALGDYLATFRLTG